MGYLILSMGVVGIMHRDVAVAVADGRARCHRGRRGRIGAVDGRAAVVWAVIVAVACCSLWWRLASVVPRHLGATVVSSRGAGRVGIRRLLLLLLPGWIHGWGGGGEVRESDHRLERLSTATR